MTCTIGRSLFALLLAALLAANSAAATYKMPPQAIVDILDAAPTPAISVSPDGAHLLHLEYPAMPPLADLARPIQRLAGLRIDPAANDVQRTLFYTGVLLQAVADGTERRVAFAGAMRIANVSWSHDGARFAFTNTTDRGLELWVGDTATATARRLNDLRLNGLFGAFDWMPDNASLLCWLVPRDQGNPPRAPAVPAGPNVQETAGTPAPVRTYQDLLLTAHDADVFEYYATAQLARVNAATGGITHIGRPGRYRSAAPSPDGRYLLVDRVRRPYSFLVPVSDFPHTLEVWDRAGEAVYTLAELPAAEEVPIGGVPTGPRGARWQPQQDATLLWVEALDGGDPKAQVPQRDVVKRLAAPFTGTPAELARTQHRYSGLAWIDGWAQALLTEYDRDRQWTTTWLISTGAGQPNPAKLWDRNINDAYGHPGTPEMRRTPRGEVVIRREGEAVYLTGQGATPEGYRPFLRRFTPAGQRSEELWRCPEGAYESVVTMTPSGFITSRETPTDPPNYHWHSLDGRQQRALTQFPDPAPQLRGIRQELITYQRADGVPLSATLYLPPDYQPGTRLPVVVWAYPLEYTDPDTAGQVRSTPYRFTRISGPSHLFFLLQGYAVLDGPQLPVIGDPETMNDAFVEQIVAGAQAAIDTVVEMGVADRDRIGVGGHSYGAFMTANLLAHSDLFRAGIARSGAYNRTLTPFGFQSERRTFWQAPMTYFAVSPFMHAEKVNEPILLIHGEVDNNSGTFPIQSERLFHALKGHGGTARLVMLPHESHGYRGRESVLHCLAEMIEWFDAHVKNAPPRE